MFFFLFQGGNVVSVNYQGTKIIPLKSVFNINIKYFGQNKQIEALKAMEGGAALNLEFCYIMLF